MMQDEIVTIGDARILQCAADGAPIASERDATDLIAATYGRDISWIALPVARLSDQFFQLKTGLAGALVQKFVNYQIRLAVIGDISCYLSRSQPLQDFVREANRGAHLWFADDWAAFQDRLAA